MGLNRSNQQLRRELQEIAHLSDDAAYAVGQVAKVLPDDQAMKLMQAIGQVYECVDKARALAERVKTGQIQVVG